MTVSTTQNSQTFLGNSSLSTFSFSFNNGVPSGQSQSQANYSVVYTDASGNQTVLSPSLYTLSFNAALTGQLWGYGGNLVYPLSGSPIASGTSLTLTRTFPLYQNISIANQDSFAPDVIEQADDTTEMQLQQVASVQARAIQIPAVDPSSVITVLPAAAKRAGQYLAFDASGNATPALSSPGTVPISGAMQPVVEAATIALALDQLDITAMQPVIQASSLSQARTAMDVAQGAIAQFNCRLSNMGTGNPFLVAQLVPYFGNLLFINGTNQIIPAGNLSVSGGVQGNYANCSIDKATGLALATDTSYYVYAYMNGSTMTLDFSTTGWVVDTTWGVPVKSTDRTCTLVGFLHTTSGIKTFGAITGGSSYTNGTYNNVPLTGGTGFFATANITVSGGAVTAVTLLNGGAHYLVADTLSAAAANIGGTGSGFSVPVASLQIGTLGMANAQTMVSYYNRLRYFLLANLTGSTTSTSLTNITGRIEWCNWSDDLPAGPMAMAAISNNNASDGVELGISLNGSQNGFAGINPVVGSTSANINLTARANNPGGDAYNFANGMLAAVTGGTATIQQGNMYLDNMAV